MTIAKKLVRVKRKLRDTLAQNYQNRYLVTSLDFNADKKISTNLFVNIKYYNNLHFICCII